MTAIYKRELKAFFKTPSGYVFMGIFLLASAFLFSLTTLQAQTTDVSTYFVLLMFAYVIIIPLLTMKSFAEEKRCGTEQLLLTSPVNLWGMVGAKFLAAFTMFALTIAISCINFIALGVYGEPNVGRIFGCLVGMILIASCFISIGLFISSLTDNQFVAAIGTIGLLAFLVILGVLDSYINSAVISAVIGWVSIYSRFSNFTYGIFDVASALYYISVALVFLFFTVRIYEKRRYA